MSCVWLTAFSEINKEISHCHVPTSHSGGDAGRALIIKSNIQRPHCTLKGYWSNLWILCPVDVQSHQNFSSLGTDCKVFQFSAKPKPPGKFMKSHDPSTVISSMHHFGVTRLEKAMPAFSLSQAQGLDPSAGKQEFHWLKQESVTKPVSYQQSLPDEFTATLIVHF